MAIDLIAGRVNDWSAPYSENLDKFEVRPFPANWDDTYDVKEQDQTKNTANFFANWVNEDDLVANLEGAAEVMCCYIVEKHGGLVELLSPYGAVPKVKLALLDPTSVKSSKYSGISGLADFSIESFRSDGWQDALVKQKHFRRFEFELLDWRYGIIDVNTLAMAEAGAAKSRARNGKVDSFPYEKGQLALFKAYHGSPVMVQESWLEEFLDPKISTSASATSIDRYANLSPREKILAFNADFPTSTKTMMKEELFPKMSARSFAFYFRLASAENPSLSAPGRRSKQ